MSTQIPSRPMASEQRVSPWASGLTVFAAALMVVTGIWQIFAGIAALLRNVVYVGTPQYIYEFDLTGWGWFHLILGVLVAATGFGVFTGQTWARVVGILLVGLSLIGNFLFIPYYPVWSLAVIALDVVVICALATYRREVV